MKLIDPVVGELRYDFGWRRDDHVRFLGEIIPIRVVFSGDIESELDQVQRKAYTLFWENREVLLSLTEVEVLRYYQSVRVDIVERLASDQLSQMPKVATEVEDLRKLVALKEVFFPEDYGSGIRIVGLLADCQWDESRGLAVRLENEVIVDVGPQDIVL